MPSGSLSYRRALVAVVAIVLLGQAVFSLTPVQRTDDVEPKGPDDVRLVSVSDSSDARLWPFTSRRHSFESLTLPINVVVRANPYRARSILVSHRDAAWNDTTNEWQGVGEESDRLEIDGQSVTWGEATGATRYTYVDRPGSAGGWKAETMQLHDGTYFGTRLHLRLYGGGAGSDEWTAVQAHRDYWDWFRLRHTVSGLARAQYVVERAFMGTPTVTDVSRERYANGGIIDADGWVTVVDLRDLRTLSVAALVVPLAVGVSRWRERLGAAVERLRWSSLADRRIQRLLGFVVALAILPSAVRAGSLALESVIPSHPKVIAALFYPVFALGPPLLAAVVPHDLRDDYWFAAAVGGYGAGLVIDLAVIDVAVVPVIVAIHRFTVLIALGVVAVGGVARSRGDRWNRPLVVGAVLWVVLLAWPLLIGLR